MLVKSESKSSDDVGNFAAAVSPVFYF